ncbi:hypothetical protein F5Y15DRAFT_366940 [Xylariaceae sp. FL0016]|nr:hypothetical protein F5Y15DRAFT_366940 [Xylariaceae sp. FL0016]
MSTVTDNTRRERLQNRIAQRNHRRKLKERAASIEGSVPPESHNVYDMPSRSSSIGCESLSHQTSPSLSALSGGMDGTFMGEGLTHEATVWPVLDPALGMMPMPSAMDSTTSNFSGLGYMPIPQECTCNGVLGPCSRHVDEFRDRIASMMAGPPSVAPSPRPPLMATMSEDAMLLPHMFESSPPLDMTMQPEFQTLAEGARPPRYSRSLSTSRRSRSRSQSMHSSNRHKRAATMPSSSPFVTSVPANQSTEDMELSLDPSLADMDATSAATNTARFNAMIEYVRNAGFADMDAMVSAYYTSQFQKNSVADMSQKASRGRRLQGMMQELHAGSNQWSKWEARGFRESVMECAREICVHEMEKVVTDRERDQDRRCDMPTMDGLDLDSDSVMSHDTESEGHFSSAASSSSSHLTVPDETVFQDEAPSLWALLTELAGTDGLHCDRVSQSALEMLLKARRSQQSELGSF